MTFLDILLLLLALGAGTATAYAVRARAAVGAAFRDGWELGDEVTEQALDEAWADGFEQGRETDSDWIRAAFRVGYETRRSEENSVGLAKPVDERVIIVDPAGIAFLPDDRHQIDWISAQRAQMATHMHSHGLHSHGLWLRPDPALAA